jgi:hypothetical protein
MENLILCCFENSLLNLDIQKLIQETVKSLCRQLGRFWITLENMQSLKFTTIIENKYF